MEMSPTCSACRRELFASSERPFACRPCHEQKRPTPTLCVACLAQHQIKAHGGPSPDLLKWLRSLAAGVERRVAARAREVLDALGESALLS